MLNSSPAIAKDRGAAVVELLVDQRGLGRERAGVDADAGSFEVGKNRHQRQLELAVDRLQLLLEQHGLEVVGQLQREVGALAGEIEEPFDRHLRKA